MKEKNAQIRELLRYLDHLRRESLRPAFIALGLTLGEGQPRVFYALIQKEGMTQRELAQACSLDSTTLSRALTRMEAEDWIYREPDPERRRSYRIMLTHVGREKAKKVKKAFEQLDETLCGGLEEKEAESLLSALTKMKENLLLNYQEEEEKKSDR